MKKFLLRSVIVCFWVALIASALYLPKYEWKKKDKNVINVFVWGDILVPSVVASFEEETGIRVNLSYYSSNEELIVKLKATEAQGYDLVIPSDYAVGILAKEGLLKPLDKTRFAYWNSLNPLLLNHSFDPDNLYSIPFEWELFGFGIDQGFFNEHPATPSWRMLFDPEVVDYKIAMSNDPIDAIAFAAFYLYGPTTHLLPDQANEVLATLVTQKPWVTAYASFRSDYFLATRNVSLAVASTSYIWRAKRLCPFVQFIIPQEGTFLTIENFCIPKPSTKEDQVFAFINYLCSASSIETHVNTYSLFPATRHALDSLSIDPTMRALMEPSAEEFSRYHFLRNLVSEDQTRDIWVNVKS